MSLNRILANVPVFDGGGRAATTTFAQRKIGDALADRRGMRKAADATAKK